MKKTQEPRFVNVFMRLSEAEFKTMHKALEIAEEIVFYYGKSESTLFDEYSDYADHLRDLRLDMEEGATSK